MLCRKIIFVIHLIILINSSVSQELRVICHRIYDVQWPAMLELSSCQSGASLNVPRPNMKVEIAVHPNGRLIEKVDKIGALKVFAAALIFIPQGIKQVLPGLRAIDFDSSSLSYVDADDMQQFGADLTFASFYNNRITSIDANLFMHNPNIRHISFHSNPIKYIDPKFFSFMQGFKSVKNVLFENCNCLNQHVSARQGQKMETFEWRDENCRDEMAWYANYLKIPVPTRSLREARRIQRIEMSLMKMEERIVGKAKESFTVVAKRLSERIGKLERACQG